MPFSWAFLLGEIFNLVFLIIIGIFRFSVYSCVGFGSLCVSGNFSIHLGYQIDVQLLIIMSYIFCFSKVGRNVPNCICDFGLAF